MRNCAGNSLAMVAIAGVVTLGACARSDVSDIEARMRTATVAALENLREDQVAISQAEKGPASASWKAAVGDKVYDCNADNLLRLPQCSELMIAASAD